VRAPGWALARLSSVVAAATFLEYVAGVDLRIDELLVQDGPRPEGALHPGRMSPITAFGLVVLGSALTLFPSRSAVPRAIAGVLALVGALVGFVAVFGYLYGASSLYRLGPAIRISEYTAAAMVLVAAGALSLWPEGTFARIFVRRTAGGVVMRRLFFPVVLTPTVLGLLGQAAQREGIDESLATALQAAGAIVILGSMPDGEARLVVRDQGIGIDAKDQARIFGAYERAVPTTQYPGLGLGLYLARQIAEAHGGRIDVQSDAGNGSVFIVSLPAGPPPPAGT